MAQQWTATAKAAALNAVATLGTHVALFNGDPTSAGVEVTGASYVRQALTWPSATNSPLTATGTYTFQIDPGTTFTHAAVMTAATAGDVLQWRSIGTVTIDAGLSGAQEYALTLVQLELNDPA